MSKIKITLADGKELHGTRNWWDTFNDGWGNTVLHIKGKIVRIGNHWIIKREQDDENAPEGETDARAS